MTDDRVRVDGSGFVYIGTLKAPIKFDTQTGELELYDKNRSTSALRGTPFVRIEIERLFEELKTLQGRGHKE